MRFSEARVSRKHVYAHIPAQRENHGTIKYTATGHIPNLAGDVSSRGQKYVPHYAGYSATGSPRTSPIGVIPRPGSVDAAKRPFLLFGAPSAVLTVT
jgi:hypothetical protein